MDISQIRRKFQHLWNFSVLTNYSIDLSTAYYSLQQGSLNSDDMLLYVTSEVVPKLEGSLIESQGQKWIVYQSMKEVVNQNLYEYKLYPVTDTLILKVINTQTNDLGAVLVDDTGEELTLHCFVEEYSLNERIKAQPVESFKQSFFIAANELLDYRGVYVLYYRGIKFKINSFEKSIGLIKIRATEDL